MGQSPASERRERRGSTTLMILFFAGESQPPVCESMPLLTDYTVLSLFGMSGLIFPPFQIQRHDSEIFPSASLKADELPNIRGARS